MSLIISRTTNRGSTDSTSRSWDKPTQGWELKYCCRISKQRTLEPSSHEITAALTVSTEGTQDGDKGAAHCQAHPAVKWLQPPWTTHPEQTHDEETHDTGPRERSCTSKAWFQWAQTLYLPLHRKAPNSLQVMFDFLLLRIILWCSNYLVSSCKNSYISWLPHPPLPLRNSFLSTPEMLWSRLEILRKCAE